ncbi:MAG: hypothetical protein C4526_05315 [Nitrospiraceae bacterium]|nr:MAG: hypothetical protein C4526_05315 [Nitrospiraceae bacterium]
MNKQTVIERLNIKAFYASELPSIKWNGSGMGQGLCPFHEDKRPSLSVNHSNGSFKCFSCDSKGDIFSFYQKKHNADFRTAFNELARIAGLKPEPQKKIVKVYDYTDESGKLLFQTVRYEPKDFKQRRPDAKGGWIYNLQGIQLVPYHLPEIIKIDRVIIVEGEKDADNLKALGLTPTCNPMGAGKWKPEYNQHFKGKKVAVIPDNDEPGKNHALQVAKNLKGIAESIKVIELPGLPGKGDVTDWIQSGGTKGKLLEMIEAAPEWIPKEPKILLDFLLKWNDILSLDVTTEYLLEKLIPKNSITLLFGRGGIGKTSLCMQIARAIAGGLPFGTLQTIRTPVYYVDFENPLSVLKERAEKIGQSENLYVWHISNEIQPPKLDGQEWELYKQLPAGLLICDTLRASHLSDENDSRPMSLIMGRLKALREIGFTILLLHHTPKGNENTFKGSTALLDLCDHVLGLEEVKDLENAPVEFDRQNLYKFGVRIKTRYEPHSIYLNFNPDIKGFDIAKDPDLEKMESIRELLSQPLKQKDLKETVKRELDLPEKETRRLLKKGTGIYWNAEKGDKNSTIYIPINSVCQFVSTIYTRQSEKQNFNEPDTPTNRAILNTDKTVDAVEFGSLSEGGGQTEKQDRCGYCMLTPAQRSLCEVVKPCPKA